MHTKETLCALQQESTDSLGRTQWKHYAHYSKKAQTAWAAHNGNTLPTTARKHRQLGPHTMETLCALQQESTDSLGRTQWKNSAHYSKKAQTAWAAHNGNTLRTTARKHRQLGPHTMETLCPLQQESTDSLGRTQWKHYAHYSKKAQTAWAAHNGNTLPTTARKHRQLGPHTMETLCALQQESTDSLGRTQWKHSAHYSKKAQTAWAAHNGNTLRTTARKHRQLGPHTMETLCPLQQESTDSLGRTQWKHSAHYSKKAQTAWAAHIGNILPTTARKHRQLGPSSSHLSFVNGTARKPRQLGPHTPLEFSLGRTQWKHSAHYSKKAQTAWAAHPLFVLDQRET